MKSILKNLLKNRVVVLMAIDIAIIFWIIWFESQIQYEPLLNNNMEERIFPLHSEVYNTIIIAFIVNMIVIVLESRKVQFRKIIKYDYIIVLTYLILITFFILLGYFYISTRTTNGVIDEDNALFRFPIWLFGKNLFTRIVTVKNLYMFICSIHFCICLHYIYLCNENYVIVKK